MYKKDGSSQTWLCGSRGKGRSRRRSGALGEAAVCNPPDLRSGLHIGCEDPFAIYEQAPQLSSDLILHCGHRVLKDGANLQALNADRFTVAFLPPKHKSIAVQHFQQGRIEFITARTLEKVIRVKRNCFSSTVMNFLL